MEWLVASIVLSVVLTVLLNVVLWLFPGVRDRSARAVERLATSSPTDDRRTRVIVPWRAMIIVSIVLTVVLNLVLWLR